MTEATIICPGCKAEIKLTESLAAPLIEVTRKRFEVLLADKEKEVAAREAAVRSQQTAIELTKASLEDQLEERLAIERQKIAVEEGNKAKLLAAADLNQKTQELADLQEVLKSRDAKLAVAQKAEAELVRKQRELEDARRELDLTVEKKIQDSLASVQGGQTGSGRCPEAQLPGEGSASRSAAGSAGKRRGGVEGATDRARAE